MNNSGLIKIIAIIAIVCAVVIGVLCMKDKATLEKINKDANYIANNVSYRVAPKDIKEKVDSILELSGGLREAEVQAE